MAKFNTGFLPPGYFGLSNCLTGVLGKVIAKCDKLFNIFVHL